MADNSRITRGKPWPHVLATILSSAVALAGCGGAEEQILDKLSEGGMPVSADRCAAIGTKDGSEVYRCFNGDSPVGCYSIGDFDNLIEHVCSGFTSDSESPSEEQAGLARCKPTYLRVAALGGGEISGGSIVIGVYIEHGRHRPCLLRGPMTVTLLDSAGRPLPVRGNPLRRKIAFRMSRRSAVSADMTWGGWCGPQERVELTVTAGGTGDRATLQPPPCPEDGASKSALRPLQQPRWLYGVGGATQIAR